MSRLEKEAASGNPGAQFSLGKAYEAGNGVRQDPTRAAGWYQKAAEQGNAQAQNSLGVMYWMGNGVEQDKVKAVAWYRRAARRGDSTAMFNLGVAYYNGEGVPAVNGTLAYAWFLLSSEAGDTSGQEAASRFSNESPAWAWKEACTAIGKFYQKGEDMPEDLGRASSWYRKAAEKGYPPAELALAALALKAENYAEMRRWCELAAKGRDPGAYFCLGYLFQHGLGTEQRPKNARSWYEAGSRVTHVPSMKALATMIERGEGAKPNPSEAFIWFFLAAVQGDEDALTNARRLRSVMTDEEWKRATKKMHGMRARYTPETITNFLEIGSKEN